MLVSLTTAQISVSNNHAYCKLGNGTVRDLTQDTIYTHPSSKQCNYSYTHPTSKQCNWTPDLSNYATVDDLAQVSSPWKLLGTYSRDGETISFSGNYAMYLITASGSVTGWSGQYGISISNGSKSITICSNMGTSTSGNFTGYAFVLKYSSSSGYTYIVASTNQNPSNDEPYIVWDSIYGTIEVSMFRSSGALRIYGIL